MNRYIFIPILIFFCQLAVAQSTINLLIGTYTHSGKSEGIYSYSFHSKDGAVELRNTTKSENPSYLTFSPDKKFVYAVNESGQNSTVSSFQYADQSLKALNKVDSEGNDPCFIVSNNQHVFVSNYSGGTISVFNRLSDGSLSKAHTVVKHTGKSIDPKGRQESAHVHQALLTNDQKYLLVNDLGEDHIYTYKLNKKKKENVLELHNVYKTKPGSGPRHLAISPNGKFVYVTHEYTGHIAIFKLSNGKLELLDDIQTVTPDFEGNIDAADIHISADGKFLYQSNRGNSNTINVFEIKKNGLLTRIQTQSTLGKGPRNFSIDPSGKYLLVANQGSDQVVIFDRDIVSGKLLDSGRRIDIPSPVCILFD